MENIEEIWNKGNEQISKDDTLDKDFIIKSISETSISITSKLTKIIWFGLGISILTLAMFIYSLFFFFNNTTIFLLIDTLLIFTIFIALFLWMQIKIVKKMDLMNSDLKNLLIHKIKYFNTGFQIVLHSVSLLIVFATFTLNLTMENNDGIFELRKIVILSVFYFFVYIVTLFLYKTIYSVYLKQLNNALVNLSENTLKSFDKELNKHKLLKKVIGIVLLVVVIVGIVCLLIYTRN
jgi:hypothetical protein